MKKEKITKVIGRIDEKYTDEAALYAADDKEKANHRFAGQAKAVKSIRASSVPGSQSIITETLDILDLL